MGRRGPKPEAAAVKAMKGNPGHRPVGADPAASDSTKDRVRAPEWLKNDGLAVWQRLAPKLEQMNLLRRLDAETFARYCHNFGRWLKLVEMIEKDGETYDVKSEHGEYVRAHPATVIIDRVERQLTTAEASFGLNPAERQRIFAARAALGAAGGGLFDDVEQRKPATPGRPSAVPEAPKAGKVAGFLN